MSDEAQAAQESTTPTRLEDLKPKMKITGTVKKIELFGAFVDLGVGRDGLLHISALGPQRVNKVEDVVKQGDSVNVWIRKVDAQAGRIDLTLIEPFAVDWEELKSGQVYKGKVTKLEKFGVFVDIGAERPGLVHVSEMASYRVEDPSEITKAGEEIEVKVLSFDARKKQIKLSIKALEDHSLEEEDTAEPITAMQAAFQRAQNAETPAAGNKAGKKKHSPKTRAQQEDLLSRTLANKRQ